MNHTKEPWSAQDVSGVGMVHAFDFRANAYQIFSKDSSAIDGQIVYCSPEDARRIVACVNACAGIPSEDLEVDNSTFIRMLKERNTKDDRIAALEAKVRELEAEKQEQAIDHLNSLGVIDIRNKELTASRQQVEQLVEALQAITMMAKNQGPFTGESFNQIAQEALSAIEQYTKGRKS